MPTAAKPQSRANDASAATFPVAELFGPTVQGEGPDAGRPAYFVRFGGCDYRCEWCDSMHAVDPAQVRAGAERLDAASICEHLGQLSPGPDLVVLSGGNPALHELGPLVDQLRARGFEIAVETQGSVWRPWLAEVDRVVISPKPPSSGMSTRDHAVQAERFFEQLEAARASAAVKVVVFHDDDLDWAEDVHNARPHYPFYVSAGTDVGLSDAETVARLRDRYRWLCEAVARRPALRRARVLPQLHVVAWGTALGV